MDQKKEFVVRALDAEANVAALCREFGIARPTGYAWLRRYKELGEYGLNELSRRPKSIGGTDGEMVIRIIELRREHPRWGAKKLRSYLLRKFSQGQVPAAKTIQRILDRVGEPRIRKPWKRIRVVERAKETLVVSVPNDVWTVDFKGWWRTADGQRVEPLTVRDACSRMVLAAELLSSTSGEKVRDVFVELFKTYGVPQVIRVDNGSPFGCTRAPAGLSKLSAWWTAVGVRVSFSRPGHPEDNGGHERMHRDIADELQSKPAATPALQQRLARAWQKQFNEVRPHDALLGRTPSEVYVRSKREYAGVRPPTLPAGYELRRVRRHGEIKFEGRTIFISESLEGHDIGVRKTRRSHLAVWFYGVDLGLFEWKKGREYAREAFLNTVRRSKRDSRAAA